MIYSSVFLSLQGMVSEKPVFIVGINKKHFQFYNVVISVKLLFFFFGSCEWNKTIATMWLIV